MTYPEFMDYLRANSARCRSYAASASDAEAAQTLRHLASKMETAVSALEATEIDPGALSGTNVSG